jgi:transposase
MTLAYLGIDISKLTFDVALLAAEGKPRHKRFTNDEEGFALLDLYLKRQLGEDIFSSGIELHACMEATGHYGDALARHLFGSGHKVSVVNPAGTHAFARSQLSRTKTDKADSIRIAQFCQTHQPPLWTPPSEEVATLQALVRRLESLNQMRQMEKQRQEGASLLIRASIEAHIAFLEAQIADLEKQISDHIDQHPGLKEQSALLESIPGIGPKTAAALLCELGDWSRFKSARAAAAYVGLVPRLHESGTSVRGRSPLCKIGNARLRKSLYFPAMSALRYNPVLIEMARRLALAGKNKMMILGAAMRRLVHLAYGVLKSGKPFDPRIPMHQV